MFLLSATVMSPLNSGECPPPQTRILTTNLKCFWCPCRFKMGIVNNKTKHSYEYWFLIEKIRKKVRVGSGNDACDENWCVPSDYICI